MKEIAFIGAGNMGGALVRSVCRGTCPAQVLVYEPDRAQAQALAGEIGCVLAQSAQQAAVDAKFVMLGVKPQIIRQVLADIAPAMAATGAQGQTPVLVSMAAGVSMESLGEALQAAGCTPPPLVRILPNTPAEIGEGLLLVATGEKVEEASYMQLAALLAPCGQVERTTEAYMDIASAVAGCTPAFVYMFIEALADGAVRSGLPRNMATRYAAQAVKGAAAMVLETGRHPGALKDAVCSPGGSTIVGVSVLEEMGLRSAAATAVYSAYEKTLQLGK